MQSIGKAFLNHLQNKCYQLIICRLNGNDVDSPSYQDEIYHLVEKGIGGFILFGGELDKIKQFIESLQSRATGPLFIASDIEQGVGQQVQGSTVFPCQMSVSAAIQLQDKQEREILGQMVNAIADEALDIGINMPLVPVLDINQDPENPIICTRSFSDMKEHVARFGLSYINLLEGKGLISCAKHFPGHGDTSTDSHLSLPVIRKTEEQLQEMDLVPFREAVISGVSSIMIGHLSLPEIDGLPASLSKRIITGILREDLAYEGLILTDALTMHAVKGIRNLAVKCLNAGVDILLHPDDPDRTVDNLMHAVETRTLSEELINAAVCRISRAKKKLNKRPAVKVDYKEHLSLSQRITRLSITLINRTSRLLPLTQKDDVDVYLLGDAAVSGSSPFRNFFRHCHILNGKESIEQSRGNIAVIVLFAGVEAWKGNAGISKNDRDLIHEIIRRARISLIISFGCPYVLRHFPGADAWIAGYEVTEQVQKTVLKCLEGELDFPGRMPVDIYR